MNDVVLQYQGYFSDAITASITELMESAMQECSLDLRRRLKLKAMLVEQVQNVQRYSRKQRQGSLEVGVEDSALYVRTTNQISREMGEQIARKLDTLAHSDPDSLHRQMRHALREPLADGDPGAGLGLLFLARQSSRTLDYHFAECADSSLQFSLKSFV